LIGEASLALAFILEALEVVNAILVIFQKYDNYVIYFS